MATSKPHVLHHFFHLPTQKRSEILEQELQEPYKFLSFMVSYVDCIFFSLYCFSIDIVR